MKRLPELDKGGWEAWEHDDGRLYYHPAGAAIMKIGSVEIPLESITVELAKH